MGNNSGCIAGMKYKRRQLEESGMKNGLTHKRTIQISKELDFMMTKYAKRQMKNNKKIGEETT